MRPPFLKILPFVRPYWRRAVASLALLTVMVILDLSIPRLIQHIIDQGIARRDQVVVVHTALIMLGISVLGTVIAVGNNILSVQVGESVARDLRDAVFLKIQNLSFGDLDRIQTGRLMVRLTSDTSAVQRLVQISLRIGTRAPLLMVGSLILMVDTSPALALTMLPLLVITSVIMVFFVRNTESLFLSVQQRLDRLNTVLQENVAGARLVRAFDRADFEAGRFASANAAFTDHSARVMKFMSSMSPTLTLCVNVGVVIVIWAGGLKAIRGEQSIGQIVAFTNYLLTTMTPLTLMAMLSNAWAGGLASIGRVFQVLETVPEVRDAADAKPLPEDAQGRVTYEDVRFRYNGAAARDVIEAVCLRAEPGQTVAILGATGSGKSTLVNLLPRFYDVSGGRILIDGIDLRRLRQDALLGLIGIVPQETILFTGTVRENIRYGAPEATDAAVEAAARAVQAHDFIMALPRGYDTPVRERGVNLSGGQKQRIAIARALLVRPRILILDDSTSAVDVETETRVQEALAAQAFPHTTLVVAQRISTVLTADRILVLDRGRIAAEGSHRELMKTSAIYREIYESQLGSGFGPGDPPAGPVRRPA